MSPDPQQIHRKIYPLRILGMGAAGLSIYWTLQVQHAPDGLYVLMLATCFVWPHLAFVHARSARQPRAAEARNLLLDSAIAGMWVPLMHFCVLPSVVLLVVTLSDKLNSGIHRLWWKSLPGMFGAMLLVSLWLRPEPMLDSPLPIVLATLPLLLLHTLAVSLTSYQLIRRVSRQNRELQELRRTDIHTTVFSRDHWLQMAQEALDAHLAQGTAMCLMMVDIDHFKPVNDQYGHTVGDEVLRGVGLALRQAIRPTDKAGRYGGDEFAVLCPGTDLKDAHAVAQRIREHIEQLRVRNHPELRVTCSIGVAASRAAAHRQLQQWIQDADTALYQAKHAGRNQVVSAQS